MSSSGKPLLSVLIPTLEARRDQCARLCGELERQAEQAGATHAVEILTLPDDGKARVGAKRNTLVARAAGRFVAFVDDDDTLSDHYLDRLLSAIRTNPNVDCVCFPAEIRFRGRHPRRLEHSIAYHDWRHEDGRYLRPPCHLMPIRREIALRYPFPEIDYGEDMDWTLRISRDGALRHETKIDEVLYIYNSRRSYALQWLLDRTQTIRHALGLRFVSGIALRRRLRGGKRVRDA
ncbi:MAG: glycosyltransferase [Lysobacterales bacterium]|jgi:hypothetical protein